MAREIWNSLRTDIWFYLLSFASIALIVASFFIPPMGIIDGSVLAAVGEIFGWGVLGTVLKAINKGMGATLQHGNTTVTVKDQDE